MATKTLKEFKKEYEGFPTDIFVNGNTELLPGSGIPRYSKPELKRIGKYVKKADRKKISVKKMMRPGKIGIVLKGKYSGARCVILKEMSNDLLCVIGPYNVPLYAIDKNFVKICSISLDLKDVQIPDDINIGLLRPVKKIKKKLFARDTVIGQKTVHEIDSKAEDAKIRAAIEKRKAYQTKIAAQLEKVIVATDLMKEYLTTPFTLKEGDYPHKMQF